MNKNEYWSDAATTNCVWLFQTFRAGCASRENAGGGWYTEAVFLTRLDALAFGRERPWHWGEENVHWRIYGVPCYGEMAGLLAKAGVDHAYVDERVRQYHAARRGSRQEVNQ